MPAPTAYYTIYKFTSVPGESYDLSAFFNTPGIADSSYMNTGWRFVETQYEYPNPVILWSGPVTGDPSLGGGTAPTDFTFTETASYPGYMELQVGFTPNPSVSDPPPPCPSGCCRASGAGSGHGGPGGPPGGGIGGSGGPGGDGGGHGGSSGGTGGSGGGSTGGTSSGPAGQITPQSVELATGRFVFQRPLLSLSGLGVGAWQFGLNYLSNFSIDGILGKNFS
jgi:hypothetical protein